MNQASDPSSDNTILPIDTEKQISFESAMLFDNLDIHSAGTLGQMFYYDANG